MHGELRDRSVWVYQKALRTSTRPPGASRSPSSASSSRATSGDRGRPPAARAHRARLDSSKEELYAIEEDFLKPWDGDADIDGPGQSENSVHFAIRPNWETVITPLLDELGRRDWASTSSGSA